MAAAALQHAGHGLDQIPGQPHAATVTATLVQSLATAVGPEHLGDEQVASEQVSGPAQPAGRVGGRPILRINGITRIEHSGRAYRGFQCGSD